MADILFSCVGTTDPVRGYHDGGVMHIMRHYRPEKVYLFLSKEMGSLEDRDGRFQKMFDFIGEKWDYHPDYRVERSNIDNVADLDEVNEPLRQFFREVSNENPQHRVLINLSSGTPQMKIVLALLALTTQHGKPVVGVQVSNPEKRAGTTERTNATNYSIDEELECNEEEERNEDGSFREPKRSSEPKMLALQREQRREQLRKLVERRDYQALEAMHNDLPADPAQLARHLAARIDLKLEEASKHAKGLELGFALYPALRATDQKYKELSEYYLLLRNLQLTQRYSEFVVRLNPFLTNLILRLVEQHLPCPLGRILEYRTDGRICLDPGAMVREIPDIKSELENRLYKPLEPGFSLYVGIALLRVLNDRCNPHFLTEEQLNLLEGCKALNSGKRNPVAHQLHSVTEQEIRDACVDTHLKKYSSGEIVDMLGHMLKEAYPDVCDPRLFRIYDDCGKYILERL